MIFKEKGLTWDEKKNGITSGIYYPYLRGSAAKEFEKINGKKPKNYRPFVRGDIIPILGFYREGAKFGKRTGDLVVLNGDHSLPNMKFNKVRYLVHEVKKILENRDLLSQLTVLDNDLVCPEGTWKVSNSTTQMSQCLDVNECDWNIRQTLEDVGVYRCHRFANCDNLENGEGYACSCRDGYYDKSPVGEEGTVCEDIDECKEGTHDCDLDPDLECINGNGYFTCQCKEENGERAYDEENNMYCDRFTFFNAPCKQGYILSTKIYECLTDWWSGKNYDECKVEALDFFDVQGRYNITRMECFLSMFPYGCSGETTDRHTGLRPDYQISEVCTADILAANFRPGGYRDDYVIDYAHQTTYKPPNFLREVTQGPTPDPMIFTGSWDVSRPADWNLTSPQPTTTTTTPEPVKGGFRFPGRGPPRG